MNTLSNNGPKDAADYFHPLAVLEEKLAPYADIELDESSAAELNDIKAQIMALAKNAEADRKAIKEPHLVASRAVDADFKPVKERADGLKKDAQSYLTIYLVEQQRIAEEARRKAEAEAAEAQRQAEELANNALMADYAAEQAEEARKVADLKLVQQESAGRAGSMSGMARTTSLRTSYHATVTDIEKAVMYFASHPKMEDLVIQLANGLLRSPDSRPSAIAGMEIHKTQTAA